MKKTLIKMLIITLTILAILFAAILLFFQHPQFGRKASGERLAKMQAASNYSDGAFQNQSHTPAFAEGVTFGDALKDFLFLKVPNTIPEHPIPHIITNLQQLDKQTPQLIWLGHSSYIIILAGKTFLIDPVLSSSASPVWGSVKAFDGSDIYKGNSLPYIDYLVITHDHFDHLDYQTIKEIKDKVGKAICPLGVGEHFEYWGYNAAQLIEKNWNESADLDTNLTIHFTPARHFSGRTFKRNTTLWTSYVIVTPELKIFIGGDSGYDKHFKVIGDQFGPIDWVILENGQYNAKWKNIHAMPEEQLNIIQDLKAKHVLTVHHAKFKLASHEWNEPLKMIKKNCDNANIKLATPQIGEILLLTDSNQTFKQWWQ